MIIVPDGLHSRWCCCCLCNSGQYFRPGSLICDDCAQILEALNLIQRCSSSVWISLHYFPCQRPRRSTREARSSSYPARPSMSSAKRTLVIALPPMLIVPLWSSSASVIVLSRKMLKRVGEWTRLQSNWQKKISIFIDWQKSIPTDNR